jgi:hypothetical protein
MLLCGHGRIEEVFVTDLFFSKNMQVYVSMWLQIPLKIGGVFDVIKCVKKKWSWAANSLYLSFSGQDMLSHAVAGV